MTGGQPAVAFVIPCYNDGAFLSDAVASAEASANDSYEIIIVNDGSDDASTLGAIRKAERDGHRVLHQQNTGLAASRNAGIRAATARYILPLDSDNKVRPSYLEHGVSILDSDQRIDVVYGDAQYFGARTGRWRVPEFNLTRLLAGNFIDACAVFRKSAWNRVGGYDENMPVQGWEDWGLWLCIALSGGGFRHVDEVLFDYRIRPDSMTSRMRNPESVSAVLAYVRAKEIELSFGDLMDAHASWTSVTDNFRSRPLLTLGRLIVRSYIPKWKRRRS